MLGSPTPGRFAPECDREGNYKSMQCHYSTGYCWCVDKYGQELPGTRTKGSVDCDDRGAYESAVFAVEIGHEISSTSLGLLEKSHPAPLTLDTVISTELMREVEQTGSTTATWEARKTVSIFLTSFQLSLFLTWLKFLPFLPKFYC